MKIITSKPECVWKLKSLLGEGTLWVKSLNSIFFVDIKKKRILIFNTKNHKKKIIKVNKEIGFLSQVKKSIFILGLKGELRIVDLKTKKKIKSIIVEKDKPLNRLNDGKTDPRGRLWFGSMDNLERNVESGSLYCLDNNFKLTKVDSNYMITNGPAFIIKFSKSDGSPDGMTIDKLKNLWVCHFGGACISVFNKKGKKIHKINLPAKNVTNCTFGGTNNSDLFISTARKSMNKTDLQKFKFSGSLFKVKTNIKGKATRPFKLS